MNLMTNLLLIFANHFKQESQAGSELGNNYNQNDGKNVWI